MVSFLPSMSLGSMILLLRAGSHCRPTRSAFTTCPEVTLRTLCCCQSRHPPLMLLRVSPVNSMSFNTPCRKPSLEAHLRNLSVSYDIPPTPGSNCTYQIPRTAGVEAVSGATDVVPPPRPPKPLLTTGTVPPERSPTDTYVVPRSVSETDGNYCVPSSTGGNKALRSNTIGTMDSSHLRKGRRISIIQVTCAISPSLWKQVQ